MQDSFRRSTLTLPLLAATPLAAANGVATYTAPRTQMIVAMQLCLTDTGTGAGYTNANVKVNGSAVNAANSLRIAGAASGKTVSAAATLGTINFPGGLALNAGDVVTVDIAAVPGTTTPKGGFVVLDMVQIDS